MLAKIVGSTSGGWTPDRMQAAVQMMEAGAPLFRGPQVSELGRFGGAALAMQRGIPGLSAQQAIGMLGAGLGQSVVESISEIQNLVPPAITAQQRFKKVDPLTASIEGLAIGGAISQRLFDPTGQRSAYAASALISTIAEQAPELLNRGLSPMQVLDELQKPENKALQRRVQENLQGYLISKASQYEFTTGDVSSIMAKEMIPQMRPGPQDVQNWIDRASIGTPEIQTATQLRQAGARQEAAIRTMGGPTEAVRRFLFGGETDEGRYAPGELAGLTRGTGLLGFADSAANLMRKGAFEAALLAGASPLEAGQYILDMLDTTRDPERGKQIEDARRAMAQLPQILTETQRANEEFAKQTERAQNGAAAAAQRHAHAE
jgi:hypothetical protein